MEKKAGFTLVEIIIVLAIAGLIFVIIFLAVVAAQGGRRDTARKDNVNRLIAVIHQYEGNDPTGAPPTPAPTLAGFSISDPVTSICNVGGCRTKYIMGWFTISSPCSGSGTVTGRAVILLEDGVTSYCKDY